GPRPEHHDPSLLVRRIALPVDRSRRDGDEVPRVGLHDLRPSRARFHAKDAGHDVDHAVVLAVVMPAGDHAGVGPGHPGPHLTGGHRFLADHPRSPFPRDPVLGTDPDHPLAGHGPQLTWTVPPEASTPVRYHLQAAMALGQNFPRVLDAARDGA